MNNPTKNLRDGELVSEEGKFTSPLSVILSSTDEEVVVKKLALRCQTNYKTVEPVTVKIQKLRLSDNNYLDSDQDLIFLALDNNFTTETQALSKAKWKTSITLEDEIKDSNKIFWIKIISKKAEQPNLDKTNALSISTTVKNVNDNSISEVSKTTVNFHADIFRRISRNFVSDKNVVTEQIVKDYSDRIKKAAYYKELIVKSFLVNGMFPSEIEIRQRMEDIDTSLSIFQASPVVAGDYFDAKKFNQNLLDIMQDLKFLYELAYQICVKDYEEILSFADTHLTELETLANQYDYRSKYELGSTYLGNTIFEQTEGFDITVDNQQVKINLGTISAHNGSKLACIFDATNIIPTQVFFNFNGEYCSPYALNRDFKIVDGDLNRQIYSVEIAEDTLITSPYPLVTENFEPTTKNKYIVYGGKNHFSHIEVGNNLAFLEIESDKIVAAPNTGSISFYIVDGTYANFNFASQPDKKNFDGTSITNLTSRHLIQIEHSATLNFSIETDGTIYAEKQIGTVQNEKLYYPEIHQVHSFLIEEYDGEATTDFEVTVLVNEFKSDSPINVNLIAIKELSTLEGI